MALPVTRARARSLLLASAVVALAPAAARAEPPPRQLVLAAGKARTELRPILEALCRRAAEGSLRGRYGEVLLLGEASELGRATSSMPPGSDEEAATDFFNVLRAADHELVGCPPTGGERRVGTPADVLFLDISFSASGKINVEAKQLRNEGTLPKSEVVRAKSALGVSLTSAADVEAFVGCLGWSFWEIKDWLQPGTKCSQWGIDAPEAPRPFWTRKRASYAVGGAGVLALGVGAFFAARAASEVQHCEPCDDAQHSSNASARTSATVADVGLGVAIVAIGTAAYLWLTSKEEAKASPPAQAVRLEADLRPRGGSIMLGGSW